MSTVLKSSLLNLAATSVSLAAGFAVSILNARLLGPEGSGLAAFALWFAASLSALTDRGLPQTLLRTLGAPENRPDGHWRSIARTAFGLFIRPVLFAGAGTAAFAAWTAWRDGAKDGLFWAATLLLFLLYALFAFSTAAARGRGHFRETAAATVSGSLLQLPFIAAGALFCGAAGAVAGMALRFVPQVLHLRRHVDFSLPPRPESLTPPMRLYARQMWLSDAIDIVLMTRLEIALLGLFFAPADMGYFAAAAVFAGLVGQFALQLSPALIVGFSAEAPDGAARAALFSKAMRFTALIVFPVALGGAAIVPRLLPLVFGEAFQPAAGAAGLLLAASALSGVAVVPWAFLAATGGSGSLLRIMAVSAAATVAVLTSAIWLKGLNGAALARLAVEGLTLTLLIAAVRRAGGPLPPFRALAATALAAGTSGAAAFAVQQALAGWAGLAAAILAGALAYGALLRPLRLICAEDAAMLTESGAMRRLPGALRATLAGLIGFAVTKG